MEQINYTQNDILVEKLFYSGDTITLDYTGSPKEVELIPGTYTIECWGAQGGGINGGLGGYTKGTFIVTTSRRYYCHVGQKPTTVLGGYIGAGKSTNSSYFGGGGLSYISQYKYTPPTDVVPVGTSFTANVPGTKDNLLGITSATSISLGLTLYAANHAIGCTQFYILVNGVAISDFTVTGAITKTNNYFGKTSSSGDTPTIVSFLANPGDQIELRTVMSSGHSPKLINIQLTSITGMSSQGGETFPDISPPILVAGGGGGQGAVAGSPSGTNTLSASEANRLFGKDSDYGGGGSGYYGGNVGTATIGAGGGSNYGTSISNYISQNNVRSGNGQIIITVNNTPSKYYLISDNDKVKYISGNNLIDTSSTIANLTNYKLFKQYGVNEYNLSTPFITGDKISLLVCAKEPQLKYNHTNIDQIIYTEDYATINDLGDIIKLEITEKLNGGIIKYVFCINDIWYWLKNNTWETFLLQDFNSTIGNTLSEINNFTSKNWIDFNAIFVLENEFTPRKLKIGAILSHDDYLQKPTVIKTTGTVKTPLQLGMISSKKYTVIDTYDKYEVILNDVNKISLIIFYE